MNVRANPSDFLPLTPSRRQRIERTVELLIAMLDAMDGEPDLEQPATRSPIWPAGPVKMTTAKKRTSMAATCSTSRTTPNGEGDSPTDKLQARSASLAGFIVCCC